MQRLRVLGGFALTDPPDCCRRRLSQQRAEAVLAVLAVAGDLGCSRDRLVGLLWPETTETLARHSLRDELYLIRQATEPSSLFAVGETLRINGDAISSDVQDFQRALTSKAWTEAVAAYGGPLLAGFHLDGAPEFERWVEQERARLFRQCKWAIERLAEEAERGAKWHKAAQWWGRATELDPYDTRSVVRRVRALAQSGDRANALREAEEHARFIEAEMDLKPDSAFAEELARIRRGDFGPTRFMTPSGEYPALHDFPLPPEPRQGGGKQRKRPGSPA